MATKYLGQPFDIHGGGMENKFPHHDDEIAQSEAAEGKPFANYWIHNGMLMIRGEEMHKSLGNFVTLREAYERYEPMTIRLFILTAHYRSPLDLTEESISAAEKGRQRIWGAVQGVRGLLDGAEEGELAPDIAAAIAQCREAFDSNMDDDFNTPGALGALYDFTREVNTLINGEKPLVKQDLAAIDELYRQLGGQVLGIVPDDIADEALADLSNELVELLLDLRAELRGAKQWELADQVRDRLAELGISLKDTSDGTVWQYGESQE